MVQHIDTTLKELRELRDRIDHQQLDPSDWPLVGALVSAVIDRDEARQARMLAKLKAAEAAEGATGTIIDADYSVRDDQSSNNAPSSDASTTKPGGAADESSDATPSSVDNQPDPAGKPDPKKANGHGRNGVSAYTNAKHVHHTLTVGVVGALCESCKDGPMSCYREKVVVHIRGQAIFAAEVHHYEQARCRLCHRILRATGPAYVLEGIGTSYITYDWSACAMLIVMHYFGGAPFKRLESMHDGWGVPMADANQWNLVNASDDLLHPLYKAIERGGIREATSLRIDDTGSMVISIARKIQAEIAALERLGEATSGVRTGINATGVYLETPNGVVILFFTGRHHAGEIIDQLIKHRLASSPKLAKVTDGASKNFDHEHEDKLIEGTCNTHAFLKFRGVKDQFPAEYAVAGEVYAKIYDNEDTAKARGFTPVERMHYHREYSKPLMEKLRAMCEARIKSKLVEPRSPLWEPLTFVINQFPRLTKFCEEPGVPLDTNLIEQNLIAAVRYLAGSFNYHTENGAEVGDRHMSLVATARANRIEPVAYLTECLRNHEDLAKRPDHYLPWVYRERMKEGDSPSGPAREQP